MLGRTCGDFISKKVSQIKINIYGPLSKLVRQFSTSWPFAESEIPAYQESMTKRVGIVVNRNFEIRDIVQHIRLSNFGGKDLHSWSLKNAYKNPFENFINDYDFLQNISQ